MSNTYHPKTIEKAAQDFWTAHHTFKATQRHFEQPKFYSLCAFPYPSGALHVGHVRNYVLGDVIARYQRMQGKQVMHTIGWDAFGLPAENAALHQGINPAHWTYDNIARMREQLKALGLSYDWTRELATCEPQYYRWEQWLFLQLFQRGLAYRKTSWVNWDPVDQTILANEQVIQGRGWRSGALVERKAIPQWFLKITDYTDQLLEGLDHLPEWPESVKTMQQHWIGRSEGTIVQFTTNHKKTLEVFTTRVDTIMGVTYLAIAPEHPIAKEEARQNPALQDFIHQCLAISTAESENATQEKLGIFSGIHAIHPITNAALPIWIANFVEMDYGTGAVMGVPAHDTRDFEFAKKYQLEVHSVITPKAKEISDTLPLPYTQPGILINSGVFTGLTSEAASKAIQNHLNQEGVGHTAVTYRLRDWGISRQRYWGSPIPIIYCEQCGTVPVPEKDLPIQLPDIVLDKPGTAPPPLSQIPEFYETTCPVCQQPARRETDTFDTFVESSWYFIRFLCPDSKTHMIEKEAEPWLPVDHYIIGIEHAVLHLLYARFFYKLFHTLGLLSSTDSVQEPFTHLLTQGMVLQSGMKMSKSKGNVVDPKPIIDTYGADTLRLFILFAAPPKQSLEWSDEGLLGSHRFLKRLWKLVHEVSAWPVVTTTFESSSMNQAQTTLRSEIHTLLQLSNQDYHRYQFNTVIAHCMKLLNTLQNNMAAATQTDTSVSHTWKSLILEGLTILLKLLAPMVPHITHHLWSTLQNSELLLDAAWPSVDASALESDLQSVVVQVQGKRRTVLSLAKNTPIETIKALVMQDTTIQPYLQGKVIQKTIVVPAKANTPLLINIVTR